MRELRRGWVCSAGAVRVWRSALGEVGDVGVCDVCDVVVVVIGTGGLLKVSVSIQAR
jgi:uncharacterized membrane protein